MKPDHRILILSPSVLPSVTGNAITAERWRRGLEEKGFAVHVLASRDLEASNLKKEIDRFRPDLIHAHHAFQSGCRLLNLPFMDAVEKFPWWFLPRERT